MDSAKDILQKIKSLDVIPEAYDNWQEYRCKVTDFIITNGGGGESLLILGAGESNDIDIERLATVYKRIYLSDNNKRSLLKVVERYPDIKSRIEICQSDYVGVSEAAYEYFIKLYMALYSQCQNEGQIDAGNYLAGYVENCLKNARPSFAELEGMSCTVSLGVHSQLLNVFPKICQVLNGYMPIDSRQVAEVVAAETESIIRAYNDYIISTSEKKVIVAFEKQRLEKNADRSYVHGAYQGMMDIEKRCKAGSIRPVKLEEMTWEFYKSRDAAYDKSYLMEIGCYEV